MSRLGDSKSYSKCQQEFREHPVVNSDHLLIIDQVRMLETIQEINEPNLRRHRFYNSTLSPRECTKARRKDQFLSLTRSPTSFTSFEARDKQSNEKTVGMSNMIGLATERAKGANETIGLLSELPTFNSGTINTTSYRMVFTNIGLELESLGDDDSDSNHERSLDKFLPSSFDCDFTSPCSSDEEDLDMSSSSSRVKWSTDRPRSVRFASNLVTEVHYRPRTTNSEWKDCYYSAHELQNMVCQVRQQRIIVAEEEDLEF